MVSPGLLTRLQLLGAKEDVLSIRLSGLAFEGNLDVRVMNVWTERKRSSKIQALSLKERLSLCPGTRRVGKQKNHSLSPSGGGLLWFSTNLPFLPVEFDMVLFTFPWPSLGQQDFSPAQNSRMLV